MDYEGSDHEKWPSNGAVKSSMPKPVCNATDCHCEKDRGS